MDKLVLIDGNSIMNRAFYGIMGSKMLSADGVHTNAIYGFLSILLKIIEDLKPKYLAVAFDLRAPTFRHKMYEAYKGTRKGMPDELAEQMPIIKEILEGMNIKIYEQEGYEADDIIGTLAKYGAKKGVDVTILSGDRDTFQLAEDNITIRIPRTKAGKTETEDFNKKAIIETYEIEPMQFIEIKALMGDSSDNIPGVPGVGERTAFDLIKKYGTLKNIYKKLDDINGKLRQKLEENKEIAELSRILGTVNIAVPMDKKLDDIELKDYNNEKLLEIFNRLKLNKFIERLNLATDTAVEVNFESKPASEADLQRLTDTKTFIYYLDKDISIYEEKTNTVYYTSNVQYFKNIFEDSSVLKCSYDLKNSYIVLKKIGINPENLMFDIEIAAYLLDSGKSKYPIEEISKDYLNMDIKVQTTQINLFETINNSSMHYAYAIYKLHDVLKEKLKETNTLELFNNIEMPLVEVLADMQYTGMHIDKEALVTYGEELKQKINELTKNIYELCGEEFNINSTKQLGEILFEKLKLTASKKTKTGYSTDVDVLEKIVDEHPVIAKLLEYRQLTKLNSTYVEGLLPYIKENRIHGNFNQTVTTTGRMSMTEPNLQNIPMKLELGRKLRKVFTASSGKKLLDADYSQIELRVLAHISNDKHMVDAFMHDRDIHTEAAAKVFNVPIEEVTKELRAEAKAVNFGIVYGISDFGLAGNIGIGRKKAKEYIEQYLNEYSGIKQFMEDIVSKAKEQGYVETLFNRRRYISEINSNNYMVRQFGERIALNTPIQGTAADIIKIAMINMYKLLKENNLKSKLILQVHDELLIEVEEGEMEQVKNCLKNAMENAMILKVPLKVEMNEGENWYETK